MTKMEQELQAEMFTYALGKRKKRLNHVDTHVIVHFLAQSIYQYTPP